MPQLLHIDSSAELSTSVSRALTRLFAETWRSLGPGHTVVERDLHREPLPHLPNAGLHYAPRLRTAGETPDPAAEALQSELIAEVVAADVVVLGAPMYNWSLPSTLKAWIDYIHVLGTTVPFDTREQPLAGTPVVVVSSRGNTYSPDGPNAGADHIVPPLQQTLGVSLGMDVAVVTAELTLAGRIPAMAPLGDKAAESLSAAEESVRRLAHTLGS
ncbi:putative acyl carrier protein phosphodiesterase 1 (ACP phosphodiesterase 1) [Rhodococcus wratislaviensis]|uniref:FMN dependent NADH:quinone oxidoreductase n=1 Tax=Rhodococcus wratislaviensis TaxID=44752 RepID=A0A402CG12_RHOWR|nr:NAD(P)H-dependent oxidoreductase [Rhodococcus wratislaviensis]GCE42530.1 putative acyl carrier protein phosphodiesterase 1 (ACP phosphodiesterase 1) [Rhodococcus wratislaviensis]